MSWVCLVPGCRLDNLKIGPSLGKGMEGEVFKATVGSRVYAVKRERVGKRSTHLQHEIEFATEFANKQPDFMHLFGYRIIKDSNWQLSRLDRKGKGELEFLAKRAALPYVVEKVYSFIDVLNKETHPVEFTLNIIDKISRMRAAGWAHRDLTGGNIATTAAGPVILDYSIVINKRHVSVSTWNRYCNDYNYTPDYLLWSWFWSDVRKKCIPINKSHYEWIAFLRSRPEWRLLVTEINCPDLSSYAVGLIAEFKYPQLHQDFMIGKKRRVMTPELYLESGTLIQYYCAANRADYDEMCKILRAARKG